MDDAYEQYLADHQGRIDIDRELRLSILEAAVEAEWEIIAVAVFYLGGSSMQKQTLVEKLIGGWGGMRAAMGTVKLALELHERQTAQTDQWVMDLDALLDLRHLIAHSRTVTWMVNDPEEIDGSLGRKVLNRSRKGAQKWKRIEFDEAEKVRQAGLDAAQALAREIADITR